MRRNYTKIDTFLSSGSSIMVFGPRGTGKTYFLTRQLSKFENYRIIDLLEKSEFRRYLQDPSLLFKELSLAIAEQAGAKLVVMIDEIQLIPELLDEVHRSIEAFKPSLSFVLTGSSARKLKREDANMLAGRAIRQDFFPLGMDEVNYRDHLEDILQWGTLPQCWTTSEKELRKAYLDTYVGTYLTEEVQKESNVRNLSGFSRFLEIAAAENGQCVNYKKLGRAAGISDASVKEYFSILVDTLIAYHVPAWSYSVREQLQKSPKYYLFDNGIINSLLGELLAVPRPSTYRFGRLFENTVLGQLMQYRAKEDCSAKIYHFRSSEGKEIDFILQRNPHSAPVAIEVKSSESPEIGDVKILLQFLENYPKATAIVICRTPQAYTEQEIEFLPLEQGIKKAFAIADRVD